MFCPMWVAYSKTIMQDFFFEQEYTGLFYFCNPTPLWNNVLFLLLNSVNMSTHFDHAILSCFFVWTDILCKSCRSCNNSCCFCMSMSTLCIYVSHATMCSIFWDHLDHKTIAFYINKPNLCNHLPYASMCTNYLIM